MITEGLTYKEITLELLLAGLLKISWAIDLRIEFVNKILEPIHKN